MTQKKVLDEFILKEVYQSKVEIIEEEENHESMSENKSVSILQPK